MSNFTEAYIPSFGYGWYNESISYDALTGVHKNLYAKTDQKLLMATNEQIIQVTQVGIVLEQGLLILKVIKDFGMYPVHTMKP